MAGYLGFEATDTKPYIFISYNTQDQARLTRITKALLKHQVNIWYDNGIHRISDEEWQEQIAIHIREAEIVRRTLLSKKSMTSRPVTPRRFVW